MRIFALPNVRRPRRDGPALIAPTRHHGFTLIEVLIVMGLLVVLFTVIWGIVETFSKSFVRGEIQAERSQLVRSLSQLVTDDLGCAIQDPLHPARESNSTAVRRFGLSGTNTSMRIDVMQINPFRTGNMTVQGGVQAPELKTVYYDFAMFSTNGGGLTRRELDFETPSGTGASQIQGGMPNDDFGSDFDDTAGTLEAVGSESPSLADYGGGSLADSLTDANELQSRQPQMSMMPPEAWGAQQAMQNFANERLQLEMSAPEVVGCWFRYYDGSQWHDGWNSLERKGLPVAIEITLKIMPLGDARALRESPLAMQVPNQPSAHSMMAANDAAYARQNTANQNAANLGMTGITATGGGSLADYGEAPSMTNAVLQQNMWQQNQPAGLTVEQLALQLELSPPSEQRIIVRVPTTPLTSQKELQREQPKSTPQTQQATASQRQIAPRATRQSQRNRSSENRRRQSQPSSPDWIRQ